MSNPLFWDQTITFPDVQEEAGMDLMVCIDGAEAATVPLKDGDDGFNAQSERGALDRAYEFKQENPDSVVSIVIVDSWIPASVSDREFIGHSLRLLADLDEGEHTDSERLLRLAKVLLETSHPDVVDASLEIAERVE
jgi:hypothetical protein